MVSDAPVSENSHRAPTGDGGTYIQCHEIRKGHQISKFGNVLIIKKLGNGLHSCKLTSGLNILIVKPSIHRFTLKKKNKHSLHTEV